jgi:hypothetical protein
VCVSFQLLSFKLSSGYLTCLTHIKSIKVLSRSLPHKSLFTRPTLLKSLSGDSEVAGTVRCYLTIRVRRGNSCTCCFHHIRGNSCTCCFHHIIFVKRKVTPPDEELNTILRQPSALDFTDEILCLTDSYCLVSQRRSY